MFHNKYKLQIPFERNKPKQLVLKKDMLRKPNLWTEHYEAQSEKNKEPEKNKESQSTEEVTCKSDKTFRKPYHK